MGAPYNRDGNFVVFSHVLDSQFAITRERGAFSRGSSIIAAYESARLPWERNLAWRVECAQVLQTIGRARGVPIPGNRLSEMIVLPVLESADFWQQIRSVEEATETPASAIPKLFVSYEQFVRQYAEIRRQLHRKEGRLHETEFYKSALGNAQHDILNAVDVFQANAKWKDLRKYFPVNPFLRQAIPARLKEVRHDFVCDDVLRELFGQIKGA